MWSPFFIVGVGRSGTTLLMSMLNAHPDVAMLAETHFVRRYIIHTRRMPVHEAIQTVKQDHQLKRFDFEIEDYLRTQDSHNLDRADWIDLYWAILDHVRELKGKNIVGDKDPKLVQYLPALKHFFPQAKILHIVRDPRDVVLSRQKAGWSRDRSLISHGLTYRLQYGLGHKQGSRLFGENYLEIKYEALITEPHTTLSKVCDLIGVQYDPQMLNFFDLAAEIVAEDEQEWKQNVTRPLLTDNYEKWKTSMPRNQLICVEALSAPVFREGLYEGALVDQTLWESWQARILDFLASSMCFLYRFYLRLRF